MLNLICCSSVISQTAIYSSISLHYLSVIPGHVGMSAACLLLTPQGANHEQQKTHSMRKYAAAQVLLAESFSVLAVEPDMLLIDSPYQYLLPSPLVDLHVTSDARNGEGLVDGETCSCRSDRSQYRESR
jgi:hypothetical protein